MDGLIDKLVDLINNFDPSSYLPDLSNLLGWAEMLVRICIMVAPVLMLVFGLSYLLLPPREANHEAGYRTFFGMGSVEAWRFAQKLAGFSWAGLGLVLSIVMFLVSGSLHGADGFAMINKAGLCLLWELGAIVLCCLVINIVLLIRYDRNGRRRGSVSKEDRE